MLKEGEDHMSKAVEAVKHGLDSLRTGRASTRLLDALRVPLYGVDNPINQIATVSTPDAHSIMIQPWDKGALGAIEKAILQANLGLTPNTDGQVIRLNIPPMTEQTRKDMVKRAHALAEEGRIATRNVRHHLNDDVKKREKSKEIAEDDAKKTTEKVQKATDATIAKIDALLAAKEKEIMTV
jgi:ribosome recycling factor